MSHSVRRAAREGIEFGLCAGLVLMLAELVASMVQRQPSFYPLRQMAAAVAGPGLLESMSASAVFLAGVVVHLALSALFGVVYTFMNAAFSDRTQTRWDRQAAMGLLFGAAVWAVKYQLAARYLQPALVSDMQLQFLQLALHTFFYGWPLALFYATAERRLRPLDRALHGV